MNEIRLLKNKKFVDVEKILNLEDYKFIECIYLSLLDRYPDEEAINANMLALKKGVDKAKLILDISSSEEAKIKKKMPIGIKSVFLSTLMSYDGFTFLENVYLTILQRYVDYSAIDTYFIPFELGLISKFEIIQQIKYSKEGIKNSVKVFGLDEAIKKMEFMEKLPLYKVFTNIKDICKLIFNLKKNIYDIKSKIINCNKIIYDLSNKIKKNHSHCFSQDHFYKNMPNNVYEIFNMIK